MNQELPVNPPPWGKLIATQPDEQNISLYIDRNDENPFSNLLSISQHQDGKIYIKNISAPYLRIEETILQIKEEKELLSGERFCLNEKKKTYFDYVFEVNSQPDVNLEPENMKKLEKIENDLQKELTCAICTNHLKNCMNLTPCLHTFCGVCLFNQLKYSSKCPLCRVEVVSVAKNRVLSNIVQLVEANFQTLQKSHEKKELEEISFGGNIVRNDQGVYIGSVLNGKRDGKGKFIGQNGGIYEGNWKNDKREGKGVMINNDGGKYDGYWMNDLKHGTGKFLWADKEEYEGDFKNGRHGYGIMKYSEGSFCKGNWQKDKREGKGLMTYSNGDQYDGPWRNDKRHGAGKYIWTSGQEYEGSFHHDCLTGFGTMKSQDGRIWQGHWENGKKQGEGIFRHTNGDKYHGKWASDILQPEVKIEYSNGEKYKGEIDTESFEKQGKGVLILKNGDKYKGTWIHNVLQPQVIFEYNNGEIYEGEINIENLQKNGKGVLTFKNGDVYDGNWMNDKQHGNGKEIFKGGKRIFEGVWEKGKISGEVILTDEDGKQYQAQWKRLEGEIKKDSTNEETDIDDSKTQDSDHVDINEDS